MALHTFNIVIYSNNRKDILYNEQLQGGGGEFGLLYDTYGLEPAVYFTGVGADNQQSGILGWYVYQGKGNFQGISTIPFATTPIELPATFPQEDIVFYVVDGSFARVFMDNGKTYEEIARIGASQKATLECQDKLMLGDLIIMWETLGAGLQANFFVDVDGEIKEIVIDENQMGVIKCGGKKIPYNLEISVIDKDKVQE